MMRRRTSAFAYVIDRSIGLGATHQFRDELYAEASRSMAAMSSNFIYRAGMKTWAMEIDPVDDRYLLVGTAKSDVLLFDLHTLDQADNIQHTNNSSNSVSGVYNTTNPLAPVCSARASRPPPHPNVHNASSPSLSLQFGVSGVDWYPIDGGLFITSSFDGCVRVWDSDTFTVISTFTLPDKVYTAKFSKAARTHALIAAASAQHDVRLCDLSSQTAVHSLIGHTDAVWSLAWSPLNEFELSTGSRSGEVRVWDIRRSGATACLRCLNQDGTASIPGRANVVHTNVRRTRTPTLEAAARPASVATGRKRQRLASSSSVNNQTDPRHSAAAARIATSRVALRDAQTHQQQQRERGRSHAVGTHGAKRNDPHAAASTSFVTAHRGGVTSVAYTPDGRFLLTSGTDARLRLWHSATGAHQFANYEGLSAASATTGNNRSSGIAAGRSVQLAVVQEADAASSTLVFHPSGRDGQLHAYDVFHARGTPVLRSTAHYAQIHACVYRRSMRELWTGGDDGLVMKWRPPPLAVCRNDDDDVDNEGTVGNGNSGTRQQDTVVAAVAVEHDVDAWSDDDGSDQADAEVGDVFVPPIMQQQFAYE